MDKIKIGNTLNLHDDILDVADHNMTDSTTKYKIGVDWYATECGLGSSFGYAPQVIPYFNDKFIIISSTNKTLTSSDGVKWETGSNFLAAITIRGYCIVDDTLYVIGLSTEYVFYTTDGDSWKRVYLGQSDQWQDIKYVNGEFIIFGYSYIVRSTTPLVSSSWKVTEVANIHKSNTRVAYANGLFVKATSSAILYSKDASIWTEVSQADNAGVYDVAFFKNRWFKFTNSYIWSCEGSSITNSSSWNKIYNFSDSYGFMSRPIITENMIALVTTNSYMAYYSYDGLNWNKTSMPVYYAYAGGYNNDKMIVIGHEGGAAYSLNTNNEPDQTVDLSLINRNTIEIDFYYLLLALISIKFAKFF